MVHIEVPPLRERREDIPLLVAHFTQKYSAENETPPKNFSPEAMDYLMGYEWPGNVRELRNAMEHGVVMTLFEKIVPEDLPQKIQDHDGRTLFWETAVPAELISLEEMIQRYIAYILKTTKGNQTLASEILRIDRKTLYRRLQKPTE